MASAQDGSDVVFYFAAEDVDERSTVQRGRVLGPAGQIFSSLILAPQTRYRLWVLRTPDLAFGSVDVTTPGPGRSFQIPDVLLQPLVPSHDADEDQLGDLGEWIVGTDPETPDTDGDQIVDGVELIQGSDPLDGLPVRTGIIGSVDTPGDATAVVGVDETVVVVDRLPDRGGFVTVHNAFAGLEPTAIAQLALQDTPNQVAATTRGGIGSVVAVAARNGLVVVDVSDPPAARILYEISEFMLGGEATAVAAFGNLAAVGTNTGRLALVDLDAGLILDRIELTAPVVDLSLSGDVLYALTTSRISAVTFDGGELAVAGFATDPVVFVSNGLALFAGGDFAWAVHATGPNTFDLSDPLQPVLTNTEDTGVVGWSELRENGAGIGVAVLGAPADVTVYDTTDPNDVQPRQPVPTPGSARAVTLLNGMAYVADGEAGLHVVNYLPFDTDGVAPVISLRSSFDFAGVEEGKLVRVSADVDDDQQVRNVEVYRDNQLITADGSFPFDVFFTTPSRASGQNAMTLRARVFDTGGNFTWTDPIVVPLLADGTAPFARRVFPSEGTLISSASAVGFVASEPLDPATLTPSALTLTSAGPDGALGTSDDVAVGGGDVEYRERTTSGALVFAPPGLAPGLYEAQVAASVTDAAGNPLAASETWQFTIYGSAEDDRDGDGVPSVLETLLGLDPDASDSLGDGTPDGLRDLDGDGLVLAGEILFGTDPQLVDSDQDSISDGQEDADHDLLSDGAEFLRQANPFLRDSDGDTYTDYDEAVLADPRSDPLDADDIPVRSGLGVVSVRNRVPPERFLGRSLLSFSLDNRAEPFLGRSLLSFSLDNRAEPESIAGSTQARVTSVENQTP